VVTGGGGRNVTDAGLKVDAVIVDEGTTTGGGGGDTGDGKSVSVTILGSSRSTHDLAVRTSFAHSEAANAMIYIYLCSIYGHSNFTINRRTRKSHFSRITRTGN